ncbi:recombinase family protein [Pseudoflavonifractor phocaeensis]|uniref:recombinase family protein n=1 Tax=Pseudoflavonifractor phocaeensis TaxID=1870988 RepID=UPI00195BCA1B|nr:recombinase family protein [Pseudoflavonifractor phocaeensis]MBM6887506.1 recombinase family protein [Pseudoflavonifractor phocaeensis]
MGSNRKRPFGYKMEFGEIVLHPAEAETVRWIYDHYLAGDSYSALVDKLRERCVPYDGDKPWNKNMAARILADRRYTGEAGFPQIIPEHQFSMAQVRRQERATPCKKTPAQKELRKLCGSSPPAWVERQVLGLLNRLIRHPELITCPALGTEPPPEAKKLRRESDELLHRPPVDEEPAKRLAFWLASLQLDAIGPEEYETLRLHRLFQNRQPMMELDQELLHESVRRITVSNGTVTVLLKNNQTLEGGNGT